ncbi:Probable endo-1,3(4)-beta-glucanase [Seminavis robusta]|uniref:Probable endo-1,3(4)-beta-glucanase n=1 Tax=Seminavis robusta TaxID=568900 RepID=A0A9N8HAX2_9STRA|nr:Probable endo-1,3(4)-beta-glucanase [Seminavis robusta]|eukprot:Sro163_g073020.1 Probable endo-1,3(4)-beta-glucanase (478) ;mRNA; f:3704-5239
MPPRSEDMKDFHHHHHESTPLTNPDHHMSFSDNDEGEKSSSSKRPYQQWVLLAVALLFGGLYAKEFHAKSGGGPARIQKSKKEALKDEQPQQDDDSIAPADNNNKRYSGPYKLSECHEGEEFFDYYDFFDGEDSEGSAGYNVYVGDKRAFQSGIANVTEELYYEETTGQQDQVPFVYMSSAPTKKGPRESVRLEGRTLFNRGLFILDVHHMPAGCGVWPAFWLTNEEHWPDYGEVDIVEGINNQTKAKTALHTSSKCSMYAHVAEYNRTGVWDRATGIPDTYTGDMDFATSVPADNCWNLAAHQWSNQGCVTVTSEDGTIGVPLNEAGGGVYVLEWDPEHRYIRSWVFPRNKDLPSNLEGAIETAHVKDSSQQIVPDPQEWGLPYAYFAIGPTTGCSADHFRDMRIVFNTAFCGTVAGNRFGRDCPAEAQKFQQGEEYNPVQSCNAFIESDPADVMAEAYWKVRGVYVYERELEKKR